MKKKRMERLLSLLMCVVLALSQVAIPAAYALGGDSTGRLVGTYENETAVEDDGVEQTSAEEEPSEDEIQRMLEQVRLRIANHRFVSQRKYSLATIRLMA